MSVYSSVFPSTPVPGPKGPCRALLSPEVQSCHNFIFGSIGDEGRLWETGEVRWESDSEGRHRFREDPTHETGGA